MIKTFNEYQKEAVNLRVSLNRFLEVFPKTDNNIIKLLAIVYDGLGLGEAGEVQGKIKKVIRDNGGIITEEHKIELMKEAGDVLWYLASLCDNLDVTLEDVANENIEKLKSRHERGTVHGSGDNR
jgi:NTP pyrophosphatase (non-canonical NTP hydrolase)